MKSQSITKQAYGFEEYDKPNSLMNAKLEKVAALCKGNTLLDIGAGDGTFIGKVAKRFKKVTAVEQDRNLYILAKRNISRHVIIHHMPAENLRLIGEKFDTITALDVVEHLDNPCIVLNEIREHLNTDGIFIMTVPGWFDFVWRILGKNPQHRTIHTAYGWKRLVEKAGFKIVKADVVRRIGPLGLCNLIVAKER